MEHDLSMRHHDQVVQLAQELASASEALATSIGGDDTAIAAPTVYELLTTLMTTLMTLTRSTHGLRARLVASLYSEEVLFSDVDLAAGESRDATESVLAADAAILGSVISLELAERCLSGARSAISGQVNEFVSADVNTTSPAT